MSEAEQRSEQGFLRLGNAMGEFDITCAPQTVSESVMTKAQAFFYAHGRAGEVSQGYLRLNLVSRGRSIHLRVEGGPK